MTSSNLHLTPAHRALAAAALIASGLLGVVFAITLAVVGATAKVCDGSGLAAVCVSTGSTWTPIGWAVGVTSAVAALAGFILRVAPDAAAREDGAK